MSIFEHYSMDIPIFTPTLDLMTRFHLQYHFILAKNHLISSLPHHPSYNGTARVRESKPLSASTSYVFLDPRDDRDPRAVRHWVSLADFYTLPHVVHFESAEHLVAILQDLWEKPEHLYEISAAMRETNRSRVKSLLRYWRRRLSDIAEFSTHQPE